MSDDEHIDAVDRGEADADAGLVAGNSTGDGRSAGGAPAAGAGPAGSNGAAAGDGHAATPFRRAGTSSSPPPRLLRLDQRRARSLGATPGAGATSAAAAPAA